MSTQIYMVIRRTTLPWVKYTFLLAYHYNVTFSLRFDIWLFWNIDLVWMSLPTQHQAISWISLAIKTFKYLPILDIHVTALKGSFCVWAANERRRYSVMSSIIGRAHTQNDSCPWKYNKYKKVQYIWWWWRRGGMLLGKVLLGKFLMDPPYLFRFDWLND